MSTRFVSIDRDTPMLLPMDLRQWVAANSLAHWLVDALPHLDLSAARVNVRGTGDQQYPPSMLLLVLIFCYARGLFSSRQIERATHSDIEVRYLAANTHPDHGTIARFRRQNAALLRSAFVQVLQLAQRGGLLQLGAIAIDGTKLKAAANKRHTLSLQQMEEELAKLDVQVEALLAQAEQADAAAAAEPVLPPELVAAQARRARLLAAKAELDQLAAARHAERLAERERLATAGIPPRGLPAAGRAAAQPADTVNLSDPESALTPGKQESFIQGYNAQIAVSVPEEGGVGLILAASVVRDTSDQRQLEPMVRQAAGCLQAAGHPLVAGTPLPVTVDMGYDNSAQIMALEKTLPVRIICPPVRVANRQEASPSRYVWEQQRRAHRDARRARLEEPAERALYQRRNTTVEPTFGILKSALGFARFHLRGLAQVRAEWDLLALAFNCRRLHAASQS